MSTRRVLLALICLALVASGCTADDAPTATTAPTATEAGSGPAPTATVPLDDGGDDEVILELASTAYSEGDEVPTLYSCDGDNISPPLAWTGAPEGTVSFALIFDDPDAPDPAKPRMTWVHWVLYNIPGTARSLPEGVTQSDLPKGTLDGLNDWKKPSYGGPCPPVGKHRYFHKLYALDVVLPDLGQPRKAKLEKAMKGHVLAKSELIGLYQRR